MTRESDIQELCKQVLDANYGYYVDNRGWDMRTCPFCESESSEDGNYLSNFPHDPNCGYLIAKDLLTRTERSE